jgi:hypothetical protein
VLGDERDQSARYHKQIKPILSEYCYSCHGEGQKEGGLSLDTFASDDALLRDRDSWHKVLKKVRSGTMPPVGELAPNDEQREQIASWIKADVFGTYPDHPDPGRVTVRRLNRVEYRNTVRDLMGIDFDTEVEFPPDDTGFGFDNIGDVLSMSPLLFEKYIRAADTIVAQAVPTKSRVARSAVVAGSEFVTEDDSSAAKSTSFYDHATLTHTFCVEHAGDYRLELKVNVNGGFDFDPGRCSMVFDIDGNQRLEKELSWKENESYEYEIALHNWPVGDHRLGLKVSPLVAKDQKKTDVRLQLERVRVVGPLDEKHWIRPTNYDRFFPDGPPGVSKDEWERYARKVLGTFARRAYRRPIDDAALDKLVSIAAATYAGPESRFEEGVAQAIMAILCSPRFLYRVEQTEPLQDGEVYPLIDEYSLAARLSYYLWSTMPDDELLDLAERGQLRVSLQAQVRRMIEDKKSSSLASNFIGQWLQARDVETASVDVIAAMGMREEVDALVEKYKAALEMNNGEHDEESQKLRDRLIQLTIVAPIQALALRKPMRQETEMQFEYILREDRSLLELIDSDYTFLNKALAAYYGIDGVTGDEMRRVDLPPGSPRGGVLTHAGVLLVTSNPTRTSPVKRGLFVLQNILGTPPPAAPPNIPELEVAAKEFGEHEPTMREILERHRSNSLCRSCHSKMDPLGLAFENFNAMGIWRDKEKDKEIDTAGRLITGESFDGVRDLKKILANERRADFYRCITEKMFTFAVGRGVEYYDEHTIDHVAEQLERHGGRPSLLVTGIIESAAFQRRRNTASETARSSGSSETLVLTGDPP